MNRTAKVALLVVLGACTQVHARRIFAPVDVPSDASKYLVRDKQQDNYNLELWGVGFARSAGKTYDCCGKCKVPLTRLFFGKDDFTIGESFPDGVANDPTNPWLDITVFKPRVHFEENGAVFGACLSGDVTMCKKTVRMGLRARLPVSALMVERECDDVPKGGSDELNLVRRLVTELITVTDAPAQVVVPDSFAYRLDMVSKLLSNDTTLDKLVHYGQPMQIAGIDVTNTTRYPITLIRRADQKMPSLPFAQGYPDVVASGLPNDGVVGADGRYVFSSAVDYTPLGTVASVPTQRELFVVPTVDNQETPPSYQMSSATRGVRAAIEHALAKIMAKSATDFLDLHGISLGTQRLQGLGDMSLQLFANCDWRDSKYWTEVHLGAVLPTGKKWCDPLKLFMQPLGNNGHFEIEPGFNLGWNANSCVSLYTDFSYHWVLRHNECIAADFTGAKVKNIGPATNARIKWQYLLFNVDMSIVEPAYHQFGFDVGYNLYYKRCDNVCFCNQTVKTFSGTPATVDNCIPTWLTRVIAHKMRGTLYYTQEPGSIYGGLSYIFAGKNTPQEIGWHLGMMIEF